MKKEDLILKRTIEKIEKEWPSAKKISLKGKSICIKECDSPGCHGGCHPEPDL